MYNKEDDDNRPLVGWSVVGRNNNIPSVVPRRTLVIVSYKQSEWLKFEHVHLFKHILQFFSFRVSSNPLSIDIHNNEHPLQISFVKQTRHTTHNGCKKLDT